MQELEQKDKQRRNRMQRYIEEIRKFQTEKEQKDESTSK